VLSRRIPGAGAHPEVAAVLEVVPTYTARDERDGACCSLARCARALNISEFEQLTRLRAHHGVGGAALPGRFGSTERTNHH